MNIDRRTGFVFLAFLILVPSRARADSSTLPQLVQNTKRGSRDYQRHVRALRRRLPAGFTIVIEPPFVVISDEAPAVVRRRAAGTVRWAVDKLRKNYFDKDPNHILDVWLFKNRRSYESNVRAIFGDVPDTPYGYYSPSDRALIMNIKTGGGTLVHEIVHPFMEANFEACPAWFNEGLGSLYEQSEERDGRIHGATNWRLAGLQQAIAADAVPTFKTLTGLSDRRFYADETGVNYAAARYLLYYLQERSLLVPYYHSFQKNRRTDPTGYRTLVRILDEQDMAKFERRWRRYVMSLRYR